MKNSEIAKVIRRRALDAPEVEPSNYPRTEFKFGTFKLACKNNRDAIEALAKRFDKPYRPPTTKKLPGKVDIARPGKGGQSRAMLKRYEDDPDYAEFNKLLSPVKVEDWPCR